MPLVRSRAASATFFGRVSEWLTAAEELRPLGGQRYIRASFERVLAHWLPREVAAEIAGHALSLTNTLVFIGGMAVGLSVSAGLFRAGLLTLGTVWLVYRYSELIRAPLTALRAEMQQLQQAQAALMRIDELLAETNAAHGGSAILPAGACPLEFDRVRFCYVDGTPVLREVSFALTEGTVLGLIGSTGSGKSTIARLLSRMIEVQEGDIRFGGVSVLPAVGSIGMIWDNFPHGRAKGRPGTLHRWTVPTGGRRFRRFEAYRSQRRGRRGGVP